MVLQHLHYGTSMPSGGRPPHQLQASWARIETLENADLILIAGEASSHCVANTLRDVVNEFSNKECAKKIMLLTDAMSPVYQCEQLQNDFFAEMKSYGVQFGTTTDILK